MRVSILTYNDPFAAIVLSGLFNSPDIEIVSVYLSSSQFYKQTNVDIAQKVIKKSGLGYFLTKATEFCGITAMLFSRDFLGFNANASYKIKSINSWLRNKRIKVKMCKNANSREFIRDLEKDNLDLIFCIRFNQIIGKETLNKFKNKFLNFHSALLPKYKGLSSEFRAFVNNDIFSGYTIHVMAPELDKGSIIHQEKVKIKEADSVCGFSIRNHVMGGKKLPLILSNYYNKKSKPKNQKKGGSYGSWPTREELRKFERIRRKHWTLADFFGLLAA